MPAIDKDVACGRPLRSQGHACMVAMGTLARQMGRQACRSAAKDGHVLVEDCIRHTMRQDPQPADTKEDVQDTAQINRKRTRATMCCSTQCMQLQTTVMPVGAVMLGSARARAQVCFGSNSVFLKESPSGYVCMHIRGKNSNEGALS